MTPAISAVALYTGLLGVIAIWLMANVGNRKNKAGVSIGDGNDASIIRAMRGQMNFIENVPLTLIMLLIAATLGLPVWAIHIGGILLVVGRFLHAYHFIQDDAPGWQRSVGFMCSMLVLAVFSIVLIWQGISALL